MKYLSSTGLLLVLVAAALSQPRVPTFQENLTSILSAQHKTPAGFCDTNDPVRRRLLFEYGAVFIADGIQLPPNCVMTRKEIIDFKSNAGIKDNCFSWGGADSCLQKKAKESLERVFADPTIKGYLKVVRGCNRSVPCIDLVNSDWAFRDIDRATSNWASGKRSRPSLRGLSDAEVIDFDYPAAVKPLIFSNAYPGASQHHLGLAIDVREGDGCGPGSACEKALNKNQWFRTVKYDPNHFTYLGRDESALRSFGLIPVRCDRLGMSGYIFWVPNQSDYLEYRNWKCSERRNYPGRN